MTNREIIAEALNLKGLSCEIEQEDLKTYQVWKQLGYQVKKGEKAYLQIDLWIPIKFKSKEEEEKEKENKDLERPGFRKKKSSLFHKSQVEKIKME